MSGLAPPVSVATETRPAVCPACQSSSIVTTTKNPDACSYWRCVNCGEVWNVSRSKKDRDSRRPWR